MKKIAAFILFIGVLDSISAQSTLTLDSCRALALSNNKELRISAEKITAAHYEKKAAFTNYLPKIAAIGTYMRTQKEISLLSDEQKGAISQIGTTAQGSIQETFQQLAASNPELAQILQPLAPLIPGIGNALNKVGHKITVNAPAPWSVTLAPENYGQDEKPDWLTLSAEEGPAGYSEIDVT